MTAIIPPIPMPNIKERSCANCDHFQATILEEGTGEPRAGECRAHPPGFCCTDLTALNMFPRVSYGGPGEYLAPGDYWCDEWKRKTFAIHTTQNSKNPALNPAAICCKSCDHFQPSLGDINVDGLCCAHPPHACCVFPEEPGPGPWTQENAFPMIAANYEEVIWCDEWKRNSANGQLVT